MIVVIGRVQTNQDRRDELIRLGQRVAQASRQEEGCLGYRLYEDTETANAFVIIEEWASEAALQEHFATPHIAEFMGAFPAALTAEPDVQFHAVAGTRTLADVSSR
jgi:quinol monooxygenase YgiN